MIFCPYIDVDIMRQERFEGRNVGWRSEGEAIATVAEWLRRLTRNQIPYRIESCRLRNVLLPLHIIIRGYYQFFTFQNKK